MSANPVRNCIGCGASDDHPRHGVDHGEAVVWWHMDCHRLATGCEICRHQLAGVGGVDGNPKGDLLRGHLVSLPPATVEHLENDSAADPHNLTTAVITPLEV